MNALDGLEVALAGLGTLPIAAGLAGWMLKALFCSIERRDRGRSNAQTC